MPGPFVSITFKGTVDGRMTQATCQGLGCTNTKLVAAHIIPASFARDVRKGARHVIRITPNKVHVAKHQLGDFDPGILCEKCDGILGSLDDYGNEICRRFERDHVKVAKDAFELQGFDGDRFAKFVLAILWRASISKRPPFAAVKLGPYEAKARAVLFGARPLSFLPEYQLFVQRYKSASMDPSQFFYHPIRHDRGVYGIGLAGFRMTARFGKGQIIPGVRRLDLSHFLVNGNDVLRGSYVELESQPEFKGLARQAGTIVRTGNARIRRHKPQG